MEAIFYKLAFCSFMMSKMKNIKKCWKFDGFELLKPFITGFKLTEQTNFLGIRSLLAHDVPFDYLYFLFLPYLLETFSLFPNTVHLLCSFLVHIWSVPIDNQLVMTYWTNAEAFSQWINWDTLRNCPGVFSPHSISL